MFIQLYPDVVGNYVMRLYDVINLYDRWHSHCFILFLFLISFFLLNYTLMLWVVML